MKREKLPSNQCNYSISLEEIKRLNFFNYLEAIGASLIKKKSSKYGRLYKTHFGSLWVRYDYKTGIYFYINLTGADKGTIIDFVQEHILHEQNLGKVRKYISENLNLF
jgi:hypothetical protein